MSHWLKVGRVQCGRCALYLVVLLTAAAYLLTGCAQQPSASESQPPATTSTTTTTTAAVPTVPTDKVIPSFAIPTPYGDIQYPLEWKEALLLSESTHNGVYSKTFSVMLAGTRYDLFTLHFGETTEGELYGRFTDEAKTPVYIDVPTPPAEHILTDQEAQQYYAMLDGINAVVRSLAAKDNFSTVH